MMTIYQTDMAIRLEAISEDVNKVADDVEDAELSVENFQQQMVKIISDLCQIMYEFSQR